MKRYYLKNFDEILLEFEVIINPNSLDLYTFNLIDISKRFMNQLPVDLELSNIYNWIRGRSIPKNRQFVEEVLKSIGDFDNPMRVIDVSFGSSLNDSYWITPTDFKGTYDQYNLYDNPFSETLKLVAFTGNGQPIRGIVTSPELTTNGMLKKCWHREKGKTLLLKGGTFGFANTGLEPYSEYYAYQIAKKMGVDAIPYDLIKFKGELVSSCELFTMKTIGYEPIWKITNTEKLSEVSNVFGVNEFADMIVFDSVVCNTDRHFGNFGMLVDNFTRTIVGPAPLFDNGLSLFCYVMENDFDEGIEIYANTRTNAFNQSHLNMAKGIMTDRQRKMLRKLIGFKFERHPLYNLPEWRLEGIEEFIQNRVKELLN